MVVNPSFATRKLCDLRRVTEPLGSLRVVSVERGDSIHWWLGRFSEAVSKTA